jgi:hypothetical protein
LKWSGVEMTREEGWEDEIILNLLYLLRESCKSAA